MEELISDITKQQGTQLLGRHRQNLSSLFKKKIERGFKEKTDNSIFICGFSVSTGSSYLKGGLWNERTTHLKHLPPALKERLKHMHRRTYRDTHKVVCVCVDEKRFSLINISKLQCLLINMLYANSVEANKEAYSPSLQLHTAYIERADSSGR